MAVKKRAPGGRAGERTKAAGAARGRARPNGRAKPKPKPKPPVKAKGEAGGRAKPSGKALAPATKRKKAIARPKPVARAKPSARAKPAPPKSARAKPKPKAPRPAGKKAPSGRAAAPRAPAPGRGKKLSASGLGAEEIRQRVRARVEDLRRRNMARLADPSYQSLFSGYNIARWADRGYADALLIIGSTEPLPRERPSAFARRLSAALKQTRERYATDPADEDGGATGAVSDALIALEETWGRPLP